MGTKVVIKRQRPSMKVWIVAFVVLMSAATMASILHYGGRIGENDIVATVNGEPVTVMEFKQNMSQAVSETYSYFKVHYGAEENKSFWKTNYGNERPIDFLLEKTLQEVVKIKNQQIQAREKGILDDISYLAFLKRWKEENKRRELAVKNKEVLFGPMKYDEQTYYKVFMSEVVSKLKGESEKETVFNEEELKQVYERNKEQVFKKTDTVRLNRIYIPAGEVETELKAAEETMENIRKELYAGADLVELSKRYGKQANGLEVVFDEMVMDEHSDRSNRMELPEVSEVADKLSEGEISNIIKSGTGFYLVKCIERIHSGYFTFDEVKEKLRVMFIDEKYNGALAEWIKTADVEVNQEVYKRMGV